MKRQLPALLATISFFSFSTICSSPAAEPSVNPVLQQLDLDGDFVLFMKTDTVEQRVLDYVETLGNTLTASLGGSASAVELEEVAAGLAKLKAGIEWSGLLSLESYATSMAPSEGTLSRVVTIVHHSAADADKPLWRIAASEPKVLKGIHYVPAHAVYAVNSTISLSEVWKTVNEAVSTFFSVEQGVAFNQQVAMAEMVLGTNISALAESLDNEILFSIQLSEEKETVLPLGQSSITIPEPSLLIGLQTRTPLLGNLILEKLKLAQMPVAESTYGGFTLHTLNLPLPSPVPVQVTLVATKDYLLLGSTREAVEQALDSQANQNGLVASPLYQKLLGDAPEKTSGIEFVSPRFMQVYLKVMQQSMGMQAPEAASMMNSMLGGYANLCSGSYYLKTPTGIYSKGLADYGGAKPIEMAAAAYAGMLSAIAIPSFHKARVNAQENVCRNNLRILDAAKEQWAMENGKADGETVTEADISEYIPGGSLQCPMGGTYTLNPIGTPPECSLHGALR